MNKTDRLYMGIAREIARQNSACYSRKIGAVLYNPTKGIVIGIGYNGPAKGLPHCDTQEYRELLAANILTGGNPHTLLSKGSYGDKTCPRRIIGFPSGQGLEACQAVHAERNAILNAAKSNESTFGTTLYCWCCLPCSECAREIINAGIAKVVCIGYDQDYDAKARWMFNNSDIQLVEIEQDILEKEVGVINV